MASHIFKDCAAVPFDKTWKKRSDWYNKHLFYAPQNVHKKVEIAKPGFERLKATDTVDGYANRNDRAPFYGQRASDYTQNKFNTLKMWSKWSTRLYNL